MIAHIAKRLTNAQPIVQQKRNVIAGNKVHRIAFRLRLHHH